MTRIFSPKNKAEIIIDDTFIVRDDEFISFAFPNGFNWAHHAQTCSDCKLFLESFSRPTYEWLLEVDDEIYVLEPIEFGSRNDHFKNLIQFSVSPEFFGTRMKLKRCEASFIDQILEEKIIGEEYEQCAELRDIKFFLSNHT